MKAHLRAKLKRLKINMQDPNQTPGKKLLTRPGVKPSEVMALDVLLSAVNNPDISQDIEPGVKSDPTAAFLAMPPGQLEAPAIDVPIRNPIQSSAADIGLGAAPVPQTPMPLAPDNSRLYFTGKLKIGKDTTATAAGCRIFGFSEPLYAIATHFFGRPFSSSDGKDLSGARAFLQAVGNIGRGEITEAYPLTLARALLEDAIRAKGIYGEFGKLGVDWSTFGRSQTIWLDACIVRVDEYLAENPGARVAITNVRFEHERAALKTAGWSGWHCMASPATWAARLQKSKLTPQSPQVNDVSEKLAAALDGGVVKELSARKAGTKLRVIWTDEIAPCPSNRLHTTASFLQLLNVAPAPAAISTDDF